MNHYCQSRGYAAAGTIGSEQHTCYGPGGESFDVTDVCRWKYPGYPAMRAEGTSCVSG